MTHLARKLSALAVAAALGSCGDKQVNSSPPLDRLFFPTGLALRHVDGAGATCDPSLASGCRTLLLVASSNFDLTFTPAEGGTVAVIDADAAVAAARASPGSPLPLTAPGVLLGTPARIGSFAGELAVLDETTCPGWESSLGRTPQALVASRADTALYRVDLGPGGAPTCQGCALQLDRPLADPYGVTVACGAFPLGSLGVPVARSYAFVTFLRSPGSVGFLTRVDLTGDPAAAASRTTLSLDVVPTHSSAFDPDTTRLYVTARYDGLAGAFAPLRYLTLERPGQAAVPVSLNPFLRGAEPRGLALSTDRGRIYLGLRVYDPDEATRIGIRPAADLAGALVVLAAAAAATGALPAAPLALVPVDRGATVVRSLPRAGKRDLVVATATDDSSLVLYDDEAGSVAQVLTLCDPQAVPGAQADGQAPPPCPAGRPRLGAQPFGLAVEQRAPDAAHASAFARLYVGSFDRGWVNVIDIDPERPQAPPFAWSRIGQERP